MTWSIQAPDAALVLPCTGQALRTALQQGDLRALDALTQPLRVAGYRFEPVRLANELLLHGCASVADAFGHRVSVHPRVPARETLAQASDDTPHVATPQFSMAL